MADRYRVDEPLEEFTVADIHPTDLIARNFSVGELTRSDLAVRRGIDNALDTDEQLRSAIYLARMVLQPIRDAFGPVTPNSVFRSQALERALKGRGPRWTSNSQHARGEACDVEVVGVPTIKLARWCANGGLRYYDQIICECYDPAQGDNSGWVHISIKPPWGPPNRRQKLSYVRLSETGRFGYVDGFRGAA